MTEKTQMVMGTPTVRCRLVIWFHGLILYGGFTSWSLCGGCQFPFHNTHLAPGVCALLENWDCDHWHMGTLGTALHSSHVYSPEGKITAISSGHMPWAAGLPMLVLGFWIPLRTDLKTLSERKLKFCCFALICNNCTSRNLPCRYF